jgi:hypothetical protein
MVILDILQLKCASQAKEKARINVRFSEKKLTFLKEKFQEFLDPHTSITITNKNTAIKHEDGYFVFTLNTEGIDLIDSCSIKKYHFEFKFCENKLMLNDREADMSFLDSFIRKIDTIASNLEKHLYALITR